MNPKLVILSDLWGEKKSDWTKQYIKLLSDSFEVFYYDSCQLAEIDTTDYTEENLHKQFVDGGIDKAVENLLKLEK